MTTDLELQSNPESSKNPSDINILLSRLGHLAVIEANTLRLPDRADLFYPIYSSQISDQARKCVESFRQSDKYDNKPRLSINDDIINYIHPETLTPELDVIITKDIEKIVRNQPEVFNHIQDMYELFLTYYESARMDSQIKKTKQIAESMFPKIDFVEKGLFSMFIKLMLVRKELNSEFSDTLLGWSTQKLQGGRTASYKKSLNNFISDGISDPVRGTLKFKTKQDLESYHAEFQNTYQDDRYEIVYKKPKISDNGEHYNIKICASNNGMVDAKYKFEIQLATEDEYNTRNNNPNDIRHHSWYKISCLVDSLDKISKASR
jgi:hypothetical protein